MTDKQIIIDVSKCKEYGLRNCEGKLIHWCHTYDDHCQDFDNCYYKQLKAKEQECERLSNDNHTLLVTRQKLLNDLWIAEESLKDFKEICDKQCEQLEAYKMEAEEGKEINAELKAELTRANCQIADDEILQCDMREAIEELKAENDELKDIRDSNFLHALEEQKRADKLSKTLTEIKEIAEHCIKQDICTTCDNSNKCHIEDEEMPTYDVCKLILQKISEVEE